MAITISTGTQVAIARTYGTTVTMSAITNAANAVATLASGHGVVVGDFLEVTSGWTRLSGRVVRVSGVATNDVTLEGVNTTSTTMFPPGTGAGSIRRITAWDAISQIKGISVAGGDTQFADITAIDDVVEKKIPTMRNAVTIDFDVMDDTALAWFATAVAASDANLPAGLRMIFPNGSRMSANAYWAVQRTPTVSKNEPLAIKVQATLMADAMRYAT